MNPFLFKVLAFLFPLQWGIKYSRVDRYPRHWEYSFLRALVRLRDTKPFAKERSIASTNPPMSPGELRLLRRYSAFSVQEPGNSGPEERLPIIRLLMVTHPKDFSVLSHSLRSALLHVRNPIEGITVVSPHPDMAREAVLPVIPDSLIADFHPDEQYVSKSLLSELSLALPSHASWASQQLIKVFGTLRYPDVATLVLDTDTVFLRDKTWLFSEGKQLLYFRGFHNESYSRFLREWGLSDIDTLKSFVTHHMLFQPVILEKVMELTFGSTDAESIAHRVIKSVRDLKSPEFCLEYEPYGQFMANQLKDRVVYDKYSNLGVPRPQTEGDLVSAITRLRGQGHYNSVSFHNPER